MLVAGIDVERFVDVFRALLERHDRPQIQKILGALTVVAAAGLTHQRRLRLPEEAAAFRTAYR